MEGLKILTTCVGYDDILALTLPRNVRHAVDYLVVTSDEDDQTARVVESVEGVRLHRTDAFTRGGAYFNKGAAVEEGFSVLGRDGWILLLDADIILPHEFEPGPLNKEMIYGMARRQFRGELSDLDGDWTSCDIRPDSPTYGFFQLFHAGAAGLKSRPWYRKDFKHAGYSDGCFSDKFAGRVILEGTVLHIGETEENWFGRATSRLDGHPLPDAERNRGLMTRLKIDYKWQGWT
jgi:hypothetical protein